MELAAWTPRALSVLRIVTGLLFLEHGTGKLLGFPPSDHAAPVLFSLIGVQGLLELVGGFLILIGLFTRPIAFILNVECGRTVGALARTLIRPGLEQCRLLQRFTRLWIAGGICDVGPVVGLWLCGRQLPL